MEAITKERIFLWDNIKVILMMLVVITHSVNIYQLEGERWIQFLWVFIMTFTMPAFMMVSGFWYKPRSFKYSCKSYLYPCVIFSIINFIVGSYSGAYTPPPSLLRYGQQNQHGQCGIFGHYLSMPLLLLYY